MKPQRIILIRHGESEANIDASVRGLKPDYTAELTPLGIEQAGVAGGQLKEIVKDETLFFYVSPYWRTRMTFEQIMTHFEKDKIKWREEPRLREQEWGHLRNSEEARIIETERDSFGTFYFRLPDGESAADVYDRVSDFFGSMHRDFEKEDYPDNVVIVTHGMTIRVFLMRWLHWTVEEFEQFANPKNCQMIILEKDTEGRYKVTKELIKREVAHKYQRPTVI